MESPKQQSNLFTYLDRVTGEGGIKTTNKIELEIPTKTIAVLAGLGVGLVVLSVVLRKVIG